MALYFNPETGQWEDDDPQKQAQAEGPSRTEIAGMSLDERLELDSKERDKTKEDMWAAPEAAKPVFAENPLQAAGEVFNITANAASALVTDYADLGSYLGDTVTQLGNVAQGKRFETENFMNDADNPWTQWRMNTFEPSTQAGQAFSPIVRLGVGLLTLPKVGVKYGLMPLKLLGKAPVVGKGAQGLVRGATRANQAIKGLTAVDDSADVVKSLNNLSKVVKGKNDLKLVKNLTNTPWLYATYDDVGRAIAKGENLTGVQAFMSDTRQAVKGITNFGKLSGKQKIKTIGEALAWDAFVSFNAAGEGDLGFDEGLSNWLVEMDMPWAQAIGSPLATSADDAAIARKFKMTVEGTALGGILNGIFDMWRVGRFATKFRAATGDNKAAILNRFAGQAQDIGNGMGSSVGPFSGTRLGLSDLKEGEEALEAYRREALKNQFATERATKQGSTAASRSGAAQQAPLATREPGVFESGAAQRNQIRAVDVQEVVDDPSLVRTGVDEVDVQEVGPAGSLPPAPDIVPSPGGAIDNLPIEEANVTVPPTVEPVVTPQTIRSGFRESLIQKFRDLPIDLVENSSGQFVQLKDQTKALMPTTRTGMLQYMLDNPPRVNALGLENGVDSIWRNFLTDRGLQEGWATLDPDTMQVKWNRLVARDLDQNDLYQVNARAVDDAIAYEQWQSSRGRTGSNPPNDQVQQVLGEMENPTPPPAQGPDPLQGPARPDESAQLQEALRRTDSPNPPNDEVQQRLGEMDAAERQIAGEVEEAAADTAAYNASELRRIEEAARSPVTDPDYQLVDEMLGQNLDDIGEPEIIKATTGRGWEVYGADGELLGRTQTKRAANKLADQQKKADREALVSKARQLSEDGGDQTIPTGAVDEGTTDAVSGKVKLTGRQIDELRQYPGMKRFIDEATGGRKTYDFTQAELATYVDGFKAMLQAGVDAPRARVLRNLIDKFDTALKVMAPEVRANRTTNRLVEDMESLVNKGEVCNFLDL